MHLDGVRDHQERLPFEQDHLIRPAEEGKSNNGDKEPRTLIKLNQTIEKVVK